MIQDSIFVEWVLKMLFNPFSTNVPLLYPLKIIRKPKKLKNLAHEKVLNWRTFQRKDNSDIYVKLYLIFLVNAYTNEI